MSYYPPDILTLTPVERPQEYGADFLLQQRITREQYTLHAPLIKYYPLLKSPTRPADPDDIIGAPATTKFDALWGETIAPTISTWEQPHGSTHDTGNTDTLAYDAPVDIHIKVQRVVKDAELKRLGFDRRRELLLHVPLLLLDEAGVTVQAGDKFEWDGKKYIVKQYNRKGYWKTTNLRLFMVMNCDNFYEGS